MILAHVGMFVAADDCSGVVGGHGWDGCAQSELVFLMAHCRMSADLNRVDGVASKRFGERGMPARFLALWVSSTCDVG